MIDLFEKIAPEHNLITDYIESYAGPDGDGTSMRNSLAHILRFWSNNKQDLYKVFGEEVILTKAVCFTKPTDLIEEDICANVVGYNSTGYKFYTEFQTWMDTMPAEVRWEACYLINARNLATNRYDGKTVQIPLHDGKFLEVSSGCKISKMLGKIATAFKLKGYEEFRLAHSLALNQKTLKGDLCISIHPMDYMTMSDNNCDWDSCMSWQQPGDYRQGTVEMMNSPYIVVAYLKSSTDMNVPGGTWNNKKWRQLFLVTPHIITGIRQYPYDSEECSCIVLKWLRELAQKNAGWGPYEDTMSKISNGTRNTFANIDKSCYIHFHTSFMYNDFCSGHDAYVSHDIPDSYELCFSGESECMRCGYDMSEYCEDDIDAHSLTCLDCGTTIRCSECGERIHRDAVVCVDGDYYCEYCYDNYCSYCNICEESHNNSCMVEVYLLHKEEITGYSIHVCETCLDSDKFVKLFGNSERFKTGTWSYKTVVRTENLSDEGLERFDIWDDDLYEEVQAVMKSSSSAGI